MKTEKLTPQEIVEWARHPASNHYRAILEEAIGVMKEDLAEGGTLSDDVGVTERLTIRHVSYMNGLREALYQFDQLKEDESDTGGREGSGQAD